MNFIVHGATLTLAWFFAINILVSALLVVCATRLLSRSSSPAFWFGLRMLPSAAAAAFVALAFVPSYWRYEPRNSTEQLDVTLTACAAAAVIMVCAAAGRGAVAWWRTNRRARAWMRAARPIALQSEPVSAYAIDGAVPMMALVGIRRPRLFVTQGLLDVLTHDELAASVSHELGHVRALDNLKRLLMRAAPDLFALSNAARTVERRWASAAEHDADRMSGAAMPAARYALASALVKVARLMPPQPPFSEPISTLIGGGEITSRVKALLADRTPASPASRASRRLILVLAVLTAAASLYGPLLYAVHGATEFLVHSLP